MGQLPAFEQVRHKLSSSSTVHLVLLHKKVQYREKERGACNMRTVTPIQNNNASVSALVKNQSTVSREHLSKTVTVRGRNKIPTSKSIPRVYQEYLLDAFNAVHHLKRACAFSQLNRKKIMQVDVVQCVKNRHMCIELANVLRTAVPGLAGYTSKHADLLLFWLGKPISIYMQAQSEPEQTYS